MNMPVVAFYKLFVLAEYYLVLATVIMKSLLVVTQMQLVLATVIMKSLLVVTLTQLFHHYQSQYPIFG